MSILEYLHLLKNKSLTAKVDRIKSKLARKQVINDTPIRRARTCYDHLAGVAGTKIFEKLIEYGMQSILEILNDYQMIPTPDQSNSYQLHCEYDKKQLLKYSNQPFCTKSGIT